MRPRHLRRGRLGPLRCRPRGIQGRVGAKHTPSLKGSQAGGPGLSNGKAEALRQCASPLHISMTTSPGRSAVPCGAGMLASAGAGGSPWLALGCAQRRPGQADPPLRISMTTSPGRSAWEFECWVRVGARHTVPLRRTVCHPGWRSPKGTVFASCRKGWGGRGWGTIARRPVGSLRSPSCRRPTRAGSPVAAVARHGGRRRGARRKQLAGDSGRRAGG